MSDEQRAQRIVDDCASNYDRDLQSVLLEDISKALRDERERVKGLMVAKIGEASIEPGICFAKVRQAVQDAIQQMELG